MSSVLLVWAPHGGGGPAADVGGDATERYHEPTGDDPTHGANDSPEKHEQDCTTALKFVNIPSLAANVQTFRMKITLVINFMHRSLYLSGARWERLQYAKGAKKDPRKYRGWNAATCKLETQALTELKSLTYGSQRW